MVAPIIILFFPLSLSLSLYSCKCHGVGSLTAAAELLADIIGKSSAWILDIDLDFFSTGNPYRSLFADVGSEL